MSFRLAAKANGFVWLLLRSTYTTITASRLVNFILPVRSFHVLTNSCAARNCVAASAKLPKHPSQNSANLPDQNVRIALYDEIVDLPNHPEILLIDVREPWELLEKGSIPNNLNIPRKYSLLRQCLEMTTFHVETPKNFIPVGELTDAFNLSENDFQQRYGRPKPPKSTEIIFYCQIGMRSGKATVIAMDVGYTK